MFTNEDIKIKGQERPVFKVNGQYLKRYFDECQEIFLIEVVYLEEA